MRNIEKIDEKVELQDQHTNDYLIANRKNYRSRKSQHPVILRSGTQMQKENTADLLTAFDRATQSLTGRDRIVSNS